MPAKGAELPAKVAPQDARDFSSFSANSLSGILPAGKPAFRLQGKLPQPELRRMVLAVIWTRGGTAAK